MKVLIPVAAALAFAPALAAQQLEPAVQQGVEQGDLGVPAISRPLFQPLAGDLAAPLRPWMTPVLQARLDDAVLVASHPGSRLKIDAEPGLSYECVVSRVSRYADRRMIVSGFVEGLEASEFTIALYDDAIAMTLRIPTEQRLYGVRFLGGGVYSIYRINEHALPACEGGVQAPPEAPRILAPDDDDYLPPDAGGYTDRAGGGCNAGTPMIDTMVLYTPDATAEAGSHSAIRAVALLAVDQTSESYQNSANTARARLVYANEVAYTESGSLNTDLDRLTDTNDGFIDGIHTTRDNVNADLVTLYGDSGSGLGWCGSGYGSAFSTLDWTRATSDFTHAHETGHNVGMGHDTANVDCNPTPGYGFGWRFVASSTTYRTVMAYPPGTVIKYYSNPGISYLGTATGTATADNGRVVDERDTTIEGFEVTRYDIYVEIGANPIVEIGTFGLPYDTLSEGIANIAVPSTGAVEPPNLYIRNDSTLIGTISKEMTIIPCGGAVTIGN